MIVVATWLVRCVAIAALLGTGALAWEAAARWSGRGSRWAWLSALTGSVVLPFALWLMPERAQLPVPVSVLVFDPVVVATPVAAAASTPALSATDVGGVVWAVLTVAMLAYVVLVMMRLRAARTRWHERDVDGARVWVTRNVGPAALGVRHGMVVVPAWALELDADLRALLLLHEREHVRAGDPRLVFVALLLVATMPWNPLLWMMLLRLRNAIELDCDARVLASGASPQRYGSLLLEVGRRRSGSALMMATFAEPRMFLENRIRRIAQWPLQQRHGRATMFAALALVLFATALTARVRIDESETGGLPAVKMEVEMPRMAVDTPPPALKPTFTPMTVRPELLNAAEIQRALSESYPATLRAAGIGGTPVVWFYIDTAGTTQRTQLSRSSGYPALDEAALSVASMMRFSPALNRTQKVNVWVEIPIVYRSEGGSNLSAEQRARLEAMAKRGEALPTVSPPAQQRQPMTVRPELLNPDEVARALDRNYPPLLRDAGVTGVVVAWFYIDESGRVMKTQVARSSGHAALDEAALRVAPVMRFSPMLKDDQKVPTWVEFPLAFGDVPPPVSGERNPEVTRLGMLRAGAQQAPDLPTVRVNPPETARVIRVDPALIPPAPPAPATSRIDEKPVFTPMTVRPELLNVSEVQRAMVRSYPPLLRDAGIGGTPVVWFFIDDTGTVVKTQLSKSSGHQALDEAALTVARIMRFSPAMNRDQKVNVWVEIPIVYKVN